MYLFCEFLLHSILEIPLYEFFLKSVDGVHGIRTLVAGWKVQTNPLSYGGTALYEFALNWMIGVVMIYKCLIKHKKLQSMKHLA